MADKAAMEPRRGLHIYAASSFRQRGQTWRRLLEAGVAETEAPDKTPANGTSLPALVLPARQRKPVRRRPTLRQKDLQRALKAAQDAGLRVTKVELDPISGKATISTGDPKDSATEQSGIVETWMANRVRAS